MRTKLLALLACTVLAPTVAACSAEVPEDTTDDALSMKACPPAPACDDDSSVGALEARPFRHTSSKLTAALAANHRGRDLFLTPSAPQLVIGKFAYGVADKDLEDEEVDVFVERGCAGKWDKVGTAVTSKSGGSHASVEGVEDTGGRIYFEIPSAKRLPIGRHRVRLVVAGDLSFTDLILDVVPERTKIFVSDVDGTLTSSENVEFAKLLEGTLPDAHPYAAEDYRALVAQGYRPIYITARPEWLTARTRAFLSAHGFPTGIVHTSTTITGAGFGSAAATYKKGELSMLAGKKLTISWAFGNMPSDSDAYATAGIQPESHRVFYQVDGSYVGRRIESYGELLGELKTTPRACK